MPDPRRPYPYATSHPIEELDDGRLLKDIRGPAPSKPAFLHDESREPETYRRILEGKALAPRCYGLRDGKLVLEKVDGRELWQIGELDSWCLVARELARAHELLAGFAGEAFLLRYDAAWYELWLRRACERVEGLKAVARVHEAAARRLLELPVTVVHGELYPSNVLVGSGRVWFVDWEMAGAAPGLIDLAALTTGWPEREAEAIVAAYGEVDDISLDCARLHLALRWLGWARDWTPPPEHARDWLADALHLAARLEGAL